MEDVLIEKVEDVALWDFGGGIGYSGGRVGYHRGHGWIGRHRGGCPGGPGSDCGEQRACEKKDYSFHVWSSGIQEVNERMSSL
jgi:hypothetical protein